MEFLCAGLRELRHGRVRPIRGVIRATRAALAGRAKAGRLAAPAVRRRTLDVVGVDAQHQARVAGLLDLDLADAQPRAAVALARDAALPGRALDRGRAGFVVGRGLLRRRARPDLDADRIG